MRVRAAGVDPRWEGFARGEVAAVVGAGSRVLRVSPLHVGADQSVLSLELDRPPRRIVLKLAGRDVGPRIDYQRTAAVMALARRAGVPGPAVLAADCSFRAGPWQYLMLEHVEGVEWRRVRPLLDSDEARAGHREIAAAVLKLQSVGFDSFGELTGRAEPTGTDLLSGLRRRIELRVADPRRHALMSTLLDRDAELFTHPMAATLLPRRPPPRQRHLRM